MLKKTFIFSFLTILTFFFCFGFLGWTSASDLEGDLVTGLESGAGGMEGVVKAAPTVSPAAGTYHATQSVTLLASGSSAICYTTNGDIPSCATALTCTTGTVYSSAISVASSATVKSAACYNDNSTGPLATTDYSLTCSTSSVDNGTVGSYPTCAITCNSGYTLSGSTCVASGGGGGGGGGGDVSAPSISQITATAGNTTATITWATNEASISWVVYGPTTAYGSEQKTTAYVTSHSLTLIGLSTGTTYHYQVKSKDSTGNIASYTDKTFTTSGTPTTPSGLSPIAPVSSTNPTGYTLMKATGSNDVWVVQNGLRSLVRSIDVFNSSGYGSAPIKVVSSASLAAVSAATLIKTDDSPDVYLLELNFRRKLASIEIFESYNLDWKKISTISQAVVGSFAYAPIYKHGVDLYWRDANNVLHKFPNMAIFTAKGYNVRDLVPINDMEFGSFAVGEPINN